jgi:hypothetical protein
VKQSERNPPFKIGDLVRPSDSEWSPPNVNGPYGEWVGLVVGVEAIHTGNRKSPDRVDWEFTLSVPGYGIVKLWDYYLESA